MHLMIQAMFAASVLRVWRPSSSCATSSALEPWTWFQYWDEATGMLQIVKYLFRRSKVAVAPPLRHDTTAAPILPAILPE